MVEEFNDFDYENRIVSTEYNSTADSEIENDLRPKILSDYIGQEKAKSNLKIYIEAAKMRGIYELNDKFAPFFEAHKNMPYRAQTVAYRLLARYAELWEKMSKPLILKALGANVEATEEFHKVLDDFGKYEVEIERYYDQHMFGMGFDKRFNGKLEIMNIAAR